MRNNKRNQGFTLIELLIVIAIIGILAAVLVPNLLSARTTAQIRAEQAYAQNVYTAANAYLAENIDVATLPAASQSCAAEGGYSAGNFSTGSKPATVDECTVSADGRTVTWTSTLADGGGSVGAPADSDED